MKVDRKARTGRIGWREIARRGLALAALLLPGIVWFPADAAVDPWAAGAGSLWLRADADAAPQAAPGMASAFHARVTGNTARVTLTQRFSNPTDDWMEGLYVFPLAATAAVDQLELEVGDRVIHGAIQPREIARKTYETARAAGRRAGLVDQARPNMFTTAVANIPPRGEITVRIAYLEIIPWRDGHYTLRLPLAITPRYTPGAEPGAAGAIELRIAAAEGELPARCATPELVSADSGHAHIEIELAAGFPLASLTSHHHPVSSEESGGQVRILAARAAADRDFELTWAPVIAPDTHAAVYTEQFDGETHALVLLTPPQAPSGAPPPREVIFVIDTSGSMGGPSIAQARAALALGVQRLGPHDRFNIIRFSNHAAALFAASRPVDPLARQVANRFIASLEASGGTEMRAAVELAFATPPADGVLRQVVFITDGSVGNEAEIVALIRRRLGDARLFTVGIGAAPNAWFMHEAAAAGRGSYTFIARPEQVRERMAGLFMKLERPALVGLELHWPTGVEADLATPLPRDLYAGEPLVVAARLQGAPLQGLLTLAGQDAGGHRLRQAPVVALEGEAGIARLWARERIAELSRRKRLGDDAASPAELDRRILALAMRYGLVSELTSLVAVDNTPVRPP
ncbi:MAG TPA: marine proteobacterial sortase target protein, partial [Gammaproteobacteria bacterium]|nr:marine proteobacterial sortase target protein [Gammaproteobacteria bacterium]